MKLVLTTLASTVLAVSVLAEASVPANAYDPSASQNWTAESNKRSQIYNNIKPYNYYYPNKNSRRGRAGRTVQRNKIKAAPSHSSNSGNSNGRDCTPYAGPYGYYGNPWCDGGFQP